MVDFEFTNLSLEDRKEEEAERKEKTLISRIFFDGFEETTLI